MNDTSPPKSVIVTGGASGIGLAMVEHFAALHYKIAVLDVNLGEEQTQQLQQVQATFPRANLTIKRCDVSSWEQQAQAFAQVVAEHGAIDIVMANAGISEGGTSAMSVAEEQVPPPPPSKPNLRVMDVNLYGVIYSVKLAMHYMRQNQLADNGASTSTTSRGSIVCTASNAGLYPFPVSALYAASKAGVIGLVRSMAQVLEDSRIQINALAPAVLETNIAPDKALFKHMIVTPMSTLIRGVAQILGDSNLTGKVAEIHGENVTWRPPHEFIDEDTRKNLEMFRSLNYA